MREMVFRERHEKVSQMEALGKMIARVFNMSSDKLFIDIISDYASEVFQESYDPKILAKKVAIRKRAQARVREKRQQDEELLRRLDRMGEFYDKNPPAPDPVKKRSQNK